MFGEGNNYNPIILKGNKEEDKTQINNKIIEKKNKEKNLNDCEKKVCKLKYGDKTGTGFLCIIPSKGKKLLLTCNHLFDENFINKDIKNVEKEKYLELFFNKNEKKKINLYYDRYIFTDKILDFTLIDILDDDKIEDFLKWMKIII